MQSSKKEKTLNLNHLETSFVNCQKWTKLNFLLAACFQEITENPAVNIKNVQATVNKFPLKSSNDQNLDL